MTYNKETIFNLLKDLPLDGDFYEEKNDLFIEYIKDTFYYDNGASKFVLIPKDPDADFVIKIPYNGSLHGDDFWEEYCWAENDADRPWDYCATEVYRFFIAKEHGLAECFAETKFLDFINDYPIYIQERCVPLSTNLDRSKHSLKEKTKTLSLCGEKLDFINLNWLTDFRLYYGEDIFVDFVNFVSENGWDDDLRSDNIGYINDRPVLIDYSGFWE